MKTQKKIALYTIQSINYGNRLQNYATQEFLRGMGYDVVSLRNCPKGTESEVLIKLHPQLKPVKFLLPVLRFIKIRLTGFLRLNKEENYRRFDQRIKYCDDYIGAEGYSHDLQKYEAVIAGSDQIWNTEFSFVSVNSFFPFEHSCKIAFSSSFGVDSIAYGERIAQCLKDFKAISVREDAGAAIVQSFANRKAEVLVDPTMLLESETWREIARKPYGLDEEPYILTYFLSPKSESATTQLNELKQKMAAIELFDNKSVVTRCAGPAEFLYLIDHASIVLTDSFHACVFSFLFDKPFLVFDRNRKGAAMNSRLMTLLKKFNLERKYYGSELENEVWEHDYTIGKQQLLLEREKAFSFLKKALGEED